MNERAAIKRPSIKSPCGADRYHGPQERIAEFLFPNALGGLIALRFDPATQRAAVHLYRLDNGIEVMTETRPTRTLWAAFAGTANGQEISLHPTRREALEAIYLALNAGDENEDPDEPMDEDRLEELIADHCNAGADDWHVQEVQTP